MFYISCNIETEVFFTHHDTDKAGSDAEVLKRLRQKVEGYCDQEYGFIIQVVGGEAGVSIEKVEVRKEGLFARVKFKCITFRRICKFMQQARTR
jgi:DNA-directed RNA polymerase subunit E'/Rpb7